MSLSIEQLRFSYPGSDFTLSLPGLLVEPGQSVALLGPSGSGKTTLLHLVAGILPADSGNIRLADEALHHLTRRQRRKHRLQRIGMVFQSFELLDYLDVRDNTLLQARLAPGTAVTHALEERARQIAVELGLGDKWRRRVTELSQGERQRVAVARALLLDPPLVLADEPTGNLDPANSRTVLDQLIALCHRDRRMLLTVTHDHSQLSRFDRVLDMADLLAGSAP